MTRLRELWGMVAECRAMALKASSSEIREQLLKVAEQFERLALYREQSERERVRTPVESE